MTYMLHATPHVACGRLRVRGIAAGVAAGVGQAWRQGAHHEGHLEGHEDPCGRHEGEQRGDETHT